MTISNSCTDAATRMVEAQGCPGLVAKAPGETITVGQALESKHPGEGLNSEDQE
jgi:hypothetical protein